MASRQPSWHRSAQLQPLAVHGMDEGEPVGMQPQARRQRTGGRRGIERIAEDRMAQPGQMHPQLVRAARVGNELQAAPAAMALQQLPVGAAGLTRRDYPVQRRTAADPGQGLIDRADLLPRLAGHLGQVGLVDLPLGEAQGERAMAGRVPGQQQQAGGVAVETVHQPQLPPGGGQPARDAIGQLGAEAALAQQAAGLVDHQQPGVGVENLQAGGGRRLRLHAPRLKTDRA